MSDETDARLFALTVAWMNTVAMLRGKGLLGDDDVMAIIEHSLEVAHSLEGRGSTGAQVSGARVRAELERMRSVLRREPPPKPP